MKTLFIGLLSLSTIAGPLIVWENDQAGLNRCVKRIPPFDPGRVTVQVFKSGSQL
jgi:hypothetical protein